MNRIKLIWILALFIWPVLPIAHGEQSQPNNENAFSERVDKLVQDKMHQEQIPGLALAVLKGGKILKAQGYGFADVDSKVSVTTNTVFRIGSLSKQFVATAIMILVEEGKISLDEPVNKYLDDTPKRWEKITIRHLLTHTSGIPDFYNENIPVEAGSSDFDQRVLHALAKCRLHFEPGEEFRYSNSNYHLLGMIIQKITGKPYGEFLGERIFAPLGMTQTMVFAEGGSYPEMASGYRWENGLHRTGAPAEPSAGGSILSTISDLAKWDAALYTDKLLKKSSLQQMWTPARLNDGMTWRYGFGWEVGRVNNHLIVSHDGEILGFCSGIYRAVDDRLTIIVLDNLFYSSEAVDRLVQKTSRIYLWKGPDYKPIQDKEPKVTERVRTINDREDRGKLSARDFIPAVWTELSPWRRQTQEDRKTFGPALSYSLVERTDEPLGRSYRYRVQYKFGAILLHVAIDGQNKIAVWNVEDVDLN